MSTSSGSPVYYPTNSVDLSKMTLRIMAKQRSQSLTSEEKRRISECLQTSHDGGTQRSWRIRAAPCQGADLDSQIQEILGQLNPDVAVWERLGKDFKIDLCVGLFMESINRGVTLLPASMHALASRGILLGLDIYGHRVAGDGASANAEPGGDAVLPELPEP